MPFSALSAYSQRKSLWNCLFQKFVGDLHTDFLGKMRIASDFLYLKNLLGKQQKSEEINWEIKAGDLQTTISHQSASGSAGPALHWK